MGGLKVKSLKYILLSFVFLALLITNNNYAFAQEENNSLQIEEIIVTAQKREQSAQDVPTVSYTHLTLPTILLV